MRHATTRRSAPSQEYPIHERINGAVAAIVKALVPRSDGAAEDAVVGRRAVARRVKTLVALLGRLAPDWRYIDGPGMTTARASALAGALALSDTLDDPRLSNALREAALKHLTPDGA